MLGMLHFVATLGKLCCGNTLPMLGRVAEMFVFMSRYSQAELQHARWSMLAMAHIMGTGIATEVRDRFANILIIPAFFWEGYVL